MAEAIAEEADGVFVPEVTVGDGYWTACRALERTCCVEEILVQSPRLVRRDYLRRTGGFLESLSGTEDAELRTRMIADGCRLAWIPDLIVHDEGRMSLWFIWSKRYYYGRGLKRYRAEHPGALAEQAGSAVGAYRKHWRRLAAKPAVAAGVVFLRGGEFAAYGLGAAVGALERPSRGA
jgi:arabinofuranan 3-O-arabinosyltransferase